MIQCIIILNSFTGAFITVCIKQVVFNHICSLVDLKGKDPLDKLNFQLSRNWPGLEAGEQVSVHVCEQHVISIYRLVKHS